MFATSETSALTVLDALHGTQRCSLVGLYIDDHADGHRH